MKQVCPNCNYETETQARIKLCPVCHYDFKKKKKNLKQEILSSFWFMKLYKLLKGGLNKK